jgi:DNA-binding PadR family transcriptional regulator
MMILGLVQWMQPVHGYDVRRELLSWNADKWANMQPGSIYHALRKLSEEGLLREVATEQVGTRPARTTYEVTGKGTAEFQSLLRHRWWNVMPAPDEFMAAFSFLPVLPREEAAAALRNRAAAAGRDGGGLGRRQAGLRVVDVGAEHRARRGRDRLVRTDGETDRGRGAVRVAPGRGPGGMAVRWEDTVVNRPIIKFD